jgi:hypothetical protein
MSRHGRLWLRPSPAALLTVPALFRGSVGAGGAAPGVGPEHRVPSEASIVASPGCGPGPGVEGVVGLQFAAAVNPPLPRVEITGQKMKAREIQGSSWLMLMGFGTSSMSPKCSGLYPTTK